MYDFVSVVVSLMLFGYFSMDVRVALWSTVTRACSTLLAW